MVGQSEAMREMSNEDLMELLVHVVQEMRATEPKDPMSLVTCASYFDMTTDILSGVTLLKTANRSLGAASLVFAGLSLVGQATVTALLGYGAADTLASLVGLGPALQMYRTYAGKEPEPGRMPYDTFLVVLKAVEVVLESFLEFVVQSVALLNTPAHEVETVQVVSLCASVLSIMLLAQEAEHTICNMRGGLLAQWHPTYFNHYVQSNYQGRLRMAIALGAGPPSRPKSGASRPRRARCHCCSSARCSLWSCTTV